MIMKRIHLLSLIALSLFWTGCHRKTESNKIIDGLPVIQAQNVVPVQIAQQFMLATRDGLAVSISALNRFDLVGAQFPELTPIGGMQYQFITSESRYGTATFTVRFINDSNLYFDPIAVPTSTGSIKGMELDVNGGSSNFSFSGTYVVVLTEIGHVDSSKHMTGNLNMTGPSNTLNFTLSNPGPEVTFQGMIDGGATASGTDSSTGLTTTLSLIFTPDHAASGKLIWNNDTITLFIQDNGHGFFLTDAGRVLFN